MQRKNSAWCRRLTRVAITATAGAAILATASPAQAEQGRILNADAEGALPNSYIVTLKDTQTVLADGVVTVANNLASRYSGQIRHTYTHALHGFSVTMPESQALRLAADPAVASVEQNQIAHALGTQADATWGLDRIDQRRLPLDKTYTYTSDAANVHAYIIDTGIQTTHQEFGGRATGGFDSIDGGAADDCNGHGTHVAGTVGGSQYGVAKGVQLHPVRVLDCKGSGSYDGVIKGIDWVTQNAQKPAVANMSLGGGASSSVDNAVRSSIASGVTYALAAGNGDAQGNPQDACTVSPARTPEGITVGATDSADRRASFSNYGTCLDIFAPGVSITSSWIGDDSTTKTISGTSMATPHVAGGAALYLAANPTATPQQVRDHLVTTATSDVVQDAKTGSPNKLLYTGPTDGQEPTPTDCAPVTSSTVQAIADYSTVNSPLTVTGCARNAAATTSVSVDITHTSRGDLAIDLIAPSGKVYSLKRSSAYDFAPDVKETYSVDASAEQADGRWTLRVRDVYARDTGTLRNWTLTP